MHLEQTISELELKSEKSKIVTFSSEFNGQVLVRQGWILNLYSIQSIPNLTPAFVISCCVQVELRNAGMGEERRCTNSGSSPCLLWYIFLNFGTILMDGKMNNIIILQHQKPCAFLQSISSTWPPLFGLNLKNWYLSKTISFLKCPLVP